MLQNGRRFDFMPETPLQDFATPKERHAHLEKLRTRTLEFSTYAAESIYTSVQPNRLIITSIRPTSHAHTHDV